MISSIVEIAAMAPVAGHDSQRVIDSGRAMNGPIKRDNRILRFIIPADERDHSVNRTKRAIEISVLPDLNEVPCYLRILPIFQYCGVSDTILKYLI